MSILQVIYRNTQDQEKAPTESQWACNYNDNYYGDQVCIAVAAVTA